MKIIFSRKGFDWENGGVPSPIFPGGRFCSLPIPSKRSYCKFTQIQFDDENVGRLVDDLTGGDGVNRNTYTSLDPDLRRSALPHDRVRDRAWLPMFGPGKGAQTHLEKNGVGVGDLFLFFGWFRGVEKQNGHYKYAPGARNIHSLFGWLQVGEIYHSFLPAARVPEWARHHPHIYNSCANESWYRMKSYFDTVYVGRKHLELPGFRRSLPGAGVFERYHESLCLTEIHASRSLWRLPRWMYPFPGKKPLSYHEAKRRWRRDQKGTLLRTVAKGQEFVLDCADYPDQKVTRWLHRLFAHAA